tara:strand:+ start:229 stop:501 length:273 start_codon:yes stop_codon:yes gene_type:complete
MKNFLLKFHKMMYESNMWVEFGVRDLSGASLITSIRWECIMGEAFDYRNNFIGEINLSNWLTTYRTCGFRYAVNELFIIVLAKIYKYKYL